MRCVLPLVALCSFQFTDKDPAGILENFSRFVNEQSAILTTVGFMTAYFVKGASLTADDIVSGGSVQI
jgi:hypothetical protein